MQIEPLHLAIQQTISISNWITHIYTAYYLILRNSVSLVKRIQGHTFQSITWDAPRREPTGPNQSVSPVVNYSQKVERLIRWPQKSTCSTMMARCMGHDFLVFSTWVHREGRWRHLLFPDGSSIEVPATPPSATIPDQWEERAQTAGLPSRVSTGFLIWLWRLLPPLKFTGVRSIHRLHKFRFIIDLQWIADGGRRIQSTQSFQWKTCEPTGRRDLFKRRPGPPSSSISPSFSFIFGFKVKARPGILLHPLHKGRDSSVRHVSHSNPPLTQRPLLD